MVFGGEPEGMKANKAPNLFGRASGWSYSCMRFMGSN